MKRNIIYLITFIIICSFCFAGCMREENVIVNGNTYPDEVGEELDGGRDRSALTTTMTTITTTTTSAPADSLEENDDTSSEETILSEPEFEDPAEITEVTTVVSSEPSEDWQSKTDDGINTTPAVFNEPLPVMVAKELTNEHASFEIHNNTQINYGYGLQPYFQKLSDDGLWLDVEPVEAIAVIDIWCELPSGGMNVFDLPIKEYYGELSDGQYRAGAMVISEDSNAEVIWYEFSVDTIVD